ncbi:MAG: MFS transporter [Deltaproteobacteria bacterium]|jgi:MFS transporter, DHA1 family, multidrug resistance protein
MRPSPFIWLCGTGLFAIFSSTISKSPVLPLLAAHLECSPSEVGMIASVSTLTGVLFSIPAGLLSDRFGRKNLLRGSLFVFASAPFFYLLSINTWQLVLVRFYHGLATAVFTPIAMALVADIFQTQRGERLGWFSTSTLIGRFMAPMVGGSILGAAALHPAMGFKVVYGFCGIAGILALLAGFRIQAPAVEYRKAHTLQSSLKAFQIVISNHVILWASLVEAAILFAYGTMKTFLPLYARQHGMNPYKIGILLSGQILTLILTRPMMGKFSDRHGRIRQIFWGAVFGACCIGSMGFFKTFFPLLSVSILFGLSLSTVTSATSALIADMTTQEGRGAAMGVFGSVMDIGHSTGPLAGGLISGYYGFGYCFITASLSLLAVSSLFLVRIKHHNQCH